LQVPYGKPLLVSFEKDNLKKRKENRFLKVGIEGCMPWTDRNRFREKYAMVKEALGSDKKTEKYKSN
jgi:hypothetical protein